MATTHTQIGPCTLYHGKAEDVLPTLATASVQLILVDPPYMNCKPDAWDRQWKDREAYLGWLRSLAYEWQRVLTPNGSLYCFAAPQMAAWVEVTLSETFRVLTRIQWLKDAGWHNKTNEEELRSYLSPREEILFAEHYGSDTGALGESGYQQAERGLKTSLFRTCILEAMQGTHTTAKEVTEAIGAYRTVNHGGAVSNWLQGYNIPTKAHYEAMRKFFNTRNGDTDYLRQEYEDLRQEYEELRRPFRLSAHMLPTDVWDFQVVQPAPGKHPCEKPLPLLRHIIEVSSRQGDTVLDCCAGSHSTGEAAKTTGRQAILIEQDVQWHRAGQRRLRQESLFTQLPPSRRPAKGQDDLFRQRHYV